METVNNSITENPMVYGLYGSHFAKSRACAYCYKHKCHLTVKTLKQHECLKKQCNALKKHEEHDYWRQREQIKTIKKQKREAEKSYLIN
jgi:hypothetical protein